MQDVTMPQRLIQDCHAIVVDEAAMLNKAVFEALERTLKDIRSVDFQLWFVEISGKYFLWLDLARGLTESTHA